MRPEKNSKPPITKSEKNSALIKISESLYNCYVDFNVSTQVEKMKLLSKKDLYLLLCLSLDKHDDYSKDQVVKLNLKAFKEELKDIHSLESGNETKIKELLELIKETGDKSISTRNLTSPDGTELPEPKERDEVRNDRLNEIIKTENDGE